MKERPYGNKSITKVHKNCLNELISDIGILFVEF